VSSLAQWASVGATLLAVLVALFGENWRRAWRRPELRADVRKNSAGDFYRTPMEVRDTSGSGTDDAYVLRLWVENKGKGPAEDVQVFAERLWRVDGGVLHRVEKFLPMYLLWTHAKPASTVAPRIHRDMGQHCELGFTRRHGGNVFELIVQAVPFTQWHKLPPGHYVLDLRLAAANCNPVSVAFEIRFGGWFEDEATMRREGLSIGRWTGQKGAKS
jgi:hypothetical protein